MKKLLVTGLVIVLALSLATGAVFAGGNSPKPNIEVITKIVDVVIDGVNSTVTSMVNITNIGLMNATVTNVTDTVYCQYGGGWEEVGQETDETESVIEVEGEYLLEYTIDCNITEDAKVLKNVVEVVIEGRDKVYRAIATWELKTEEPEEPETPGEPVGDRGEGQSGKSHVWHFNNIAIDGGGTSGRLNCQIKDGHIKGVFNGKGLDPEEEYCLAYNGTCIGFGTANRIGKVHIKADGDITEDPSASNFSLVPYG